MAAQLGLNGASGNALTDQEFDGYLTLTDADGDVHLGWHVLPRQAGDVQASASEMAADGSIDLTNNGVGTARVIGYSLIGQSPDNPAEGSLGGQNPVIDIKNVGAQTLFIPGDPTPDEGVPGSAPTIRQRTRSCSRWPSPRWERQTHANAPAAFEFDIDTSGDGVADFAIFNQDLGRRAERRPQRHVHRRPQRPRCRGPGVLRDPARHERGDDGAPRVRRADRHDGGGCWHPDQRRPVGGGHHFTGNVTDGVEGLFEFAPLGERYLAVIGGRRRCRGNPERCHRGALEVIAFGPDGTNPSETGVMLLYNANNFGGGSARRRTTTTSG